MSISVNTPDSRHFVNGEYSPVREKPRFKVNYTDVENPTTGNYHCQANGQIVYWFGLPVQCTTEDVLTPTKARIIKDTFTNLERFLGEIMKVTRLEEPIQLVNKLGDLVLNGGDSEANCDYHIKIVPRAYGAYSNTLASALAMKYEPKEGRPVQGVVFVNVAKLPSAVQSYTVYPHEFFATCFHEMCHALGISKTDYEKWINRTTGIRYGDDLPMTKVSWDKKNFTILHTPQCHRYAVKRYGEENFLVSGKSVPAGVEIEDGGASGTSGSHPEARIAFGEVMVGVTVTLSVISDLTFAMLDDTGWYNINYTFARGLVWGNGRAISGEPLTGFATAPLMNYSAKNHVCEVPNQEGCTFDYKAIGLCRGQTFDCAVADISSENDKISHDSFCRSTDFYNPKGSKYRGISSVHDYIMFVHPYSNKNCLDDSSFVPYDGNEEAGLSSRCFQRDSGVYGCFPTRCNGTQLYVKIGSYEYHCAKEGDKVGFFFSQIVCPPPEVICRGMSVFQFLPEDPFDDSFEPTPLIQDSIASDPGTAESIIQYGGIAIGAIVIIAVITYYVVQKRKKKVGSKKVNRKRKNKKGGLNKTLRKKKQNTRKGKARASKSTKGVSKSGAEAKKKKTESGATSNKDKKKPRAKSTSQATKKKDSNLASNEDKKSKKEVHSKTKDGEKGEKHEKKSTTSDRKHEKKSTSGGQKHEKKSTSSDQKHEKKSTSSDQKHEKKSTSGDQKHKKELKTAHSDNGEKRKKSVKKSDSEHKGKKEHQSSSGKSDKSVISGKKSDAKDTRKRSGSVSKSKK